MFMKFCIIINENLLNECVRNSLSKLFVFL